MTRAIPKAASEIRSAFLDYFTQKGHTVLPSSTLVPQNDPTLLFTNAGMNQFKEVFLGQKQLGFTTATTAQKCVRAGGKHNDLENVGYTARHHTFFEMLGNFSFGDYFKKEAISYAWDFLTKQLMLPKERLYVTVYESDTEAFQIWCSEIGLADDRIIRIGDNKGTAFASDNFWQMGETGPCGPCTEIFYDHGKQIAGGLPGTPEEDGDRYIEIWNIVFIQYNRLADGTMNPLPNPSVDTGMGLERITAVMQGCHDNYQTDLFQSLIKEASVILGNTETTNNSLRVIADHIRSATFLISDGVLPSSESRGYTLRRIIRRACRHGHKLGASGPFFHRLVAAVIKVMGDGYPELLPLQQKIEDILLQEEQQFARTLERGMKLLDEQLQQLEGDTLPGEIAFLLYDTYGFPLDLTGDIAREQNLRLDEAGFERALQQQKERARAASRFSTGDREIIEIDGDTDFTGYNQLQTTTHIKNLLVDGQQTDRIDAPAKVTVVLEQTPFYAESGGQVGDQGTITSEHVQARVTDTQQQGTNHLHQTEITHGTLRLGDLVTARVDNIRREAIALNHSATHLLHAVLRQLIGDHVTQKGSLVDSKRLRFDFSHTEPLTVEQIAQAEVLVNRHIRDNSQVTTELLSQQQAKERGAMALFGEKYDDTVRVLSMGADDFSIELCGGTHARRTGDIGLFMITAESGIASGVRRVEAITGQTAFEYVQSERTKLQTIADLLRSPMDESIAKVTSLLEQQSALEKQLQRLKQQLANGLSSELLSRTTSVAGVQMLAADIDGIEPAELRVLIDQLKQKFDSGVILLTVSGHKKCPLVVGVTNDLTDQVHAGELLRFVATQLGGSGGGRADFAQGGGRDAGKIPEALAAAKRWVEEKLERS